MTVQDALPRPRSIARYGWRPDLPDPNDAYLAVPPGVARLPHKVDLHDTGHLPPIWDQSQLGSCTAHGIKRVIDFDNHLQAGQFKDPSRLWIYYWERYLEGDIDQDAGAMIRDGMKVMSKIGAPPEAEWPYDISTFATPPANMDELKQHALADRAVLYARVPQTQWSIQHVLAGGRPFVFGFTVYPSFESDHVANSGVVPMPEAGEQTIGAHCVAAVGYEVIAHRLYVKCDNSWGESWGQAGSFYLPMRYVLNSALASDLWVVKTTTAVKEPS